MGRKKTQLVIILAALLCMLVVILPCGKSVQAAEDKGVKIDKEHFPDEFIRKILSKKYDKDKDGYLSADEISEVTRLCIGGYITSFSGIEYLSELEYLHYDWYDYDARDGYSPADEEQQATYLDLTANKKLEAVNLGSVGLKDVDLRGLKKLESVKCYYLGGLDAIHVDGCTNLQELRIEFCGKIKNLDVSKFTKLKELWIFGSKKAISAKNFDIRNCKKLQVIYIEGDVTTIDARNLEKLEYIRIDSDTVKEIKLGKKNKDIYYCHIEAKHVKKLNLKYCTQLRSLSIVNAGITSLDTSKFQDLEVLSLHGTQITKLDVTKNSKLWSLRINKSKIKKIDISKNKKLEIFYASNSSLKSLDTSKNARLKELGVSGTKIKKLDVSKNAKLRKLRARKTNLKKLDVSKNLKLIELFIDGSKLKEVDVRKNSKLSDVSYDDTMKLKGLSDLKYVWRSYWKADLSKEKLKELIKLKEAGERIYINGLIYIQGSYK